MLQLQLFSLYLLQDAAIGWDPASLWKNMGVLAKAVVVGLFIMSAYSIGVMIDRVMAYNAARKQSRQFAPAEAGAFLHGHLEAASVNSGPHTKESLVQE